MKKIIISGMLVFGVVGCDNVKSPAAYTPEMASFSNEFAFDPMRGPVKDFSQTLVNEKGQVVKRISGELSEAGCFDRLVYDDRENNRATELSLDANYYVDAVNHEKRVKLQGKCQLAELPVVGLHYDTDDNDFVTAARGEGLSVRYQYDREGYPLGKITRSEGSELAIVTKTGVDDKKKLDHRATTTLNGKTISVVTQTCDYDRHFNPLSCDLDMTDDTATPPTTAHYRIENQIAYY